MSGIIGLVNTDGKPVDREFLCRLTRSIAFRGPDAQEIQIDGSVGFGHTMLRTTREADREHQPCTLPGSQLWITADCRIDGREDLIRDLVSGGRPEAKTATDPELILHAYAAWGTDCLSRLLGDFAFAIWDAPNRRLFCARDHLGVKPFYYARTGSSLIVGNTLNTLRLHPEVSSRLNELAIADQLLFGHSQDPATTAFTDIQRLPAAHALILSGADLRIQRYWTMPMDPVLRLPRLDDYVDRFLAIFRTAIHDRMRTGSVGILMSGGLDSTSIAAIAKELTEHEQPAKLCAHTVVFDRLIPDRERHFSGIAAAHLGIPIHYHPGDDYGFFTAALEGNTLSPDPGYITPYGASSANAEMTGISRESRVALYGEGADNALRYEWKAYFRHEFRQKHFGHLVREIAAFPFLFRQLPFSKRRRAAPNGPPAPEIDPVPPWIDAGFASRLNLAQRYKSFTSPSTSGHPTRPSAYQTYSIPIWQWLFEWHDPGITGLHLEVRNPYLDIRVIQYLMSVPVVPWCRDKYLVRRAMKRYLPAEILTRPKTSLAGFPSFERWKEIGLPPGMPLDSLRGCWIDVNRLESALIDSQELLGMKLRTSSLAFFLRQVDQACIMGST